jgi:futalosine hydrolase
MGGIPPELCLAERCGFGPVVAAARTAEALARLRPRRVLLLGIAGSFDPARSPLASATTYSSVTLDGVGIGRNAPARRSAADGSRLEDEPGIAVLGLASEGGQLLTVTSPSATAAEAAERRSRLPDALAEDMEGYAVAYACRAAGVPLAIVRGISNAVGERDPRAWRLREALSAARALALEWLERASWEVGR